MMGVDKAVREAVEAYLLSGESEYDARITLIAAIQAIVDKATDTPETRA
jgi:hypothetical protein